MTPARRGRRIRLDKLDEDGVAQIVSQLDTSGASPWIGGERPPPIEPNAAPGLIVAVLVDDNDVELHRWIIDSESDAAALDGYERLAAGEGSAVVMYDGDSGAAIARLHVGEPT